MEGKLCLVTGGTSGIGLETARGLAALGARVVIVGRNRQRGERAVAELRATTGNEQVSFLQGDLSSQADTRRLAAQFLGQSERLDVLVNNAGGFFLRRVFSPEGIEMTFALNHLSYFLLTHLLLERLKASAPSRIVNVASESHRRGTMDFDDLQGLRRYNGWKAYSRSKLGNVLFTYELARRLEGTGVTVNAVHPGFVRTRLGTDNPWPLRLLMRLVMMRGISPAKGAETVVYLASSPQVEGQTGGYWAHLRRVESSPLSQDRQLAQRLWQVSLEMTGLQGGQ
jgi:NAD(P)-dependent dehydrogenase (short-subunit alcohol dehydrogenase family)